MGIALLVLILFFPGIVRADTLDDFIAGKTITSYGVCQIPLPKGGTVSITCVRLDDVKQPEKFWVVFFDGFRKPLLAVEVEGGISKIVWEYSWISI